MNMEMPAVSDQVLYDIPLDEIFLDNDFNCRGRIAPIDVYSLAKTIKKEGLLQAIVVQPYDKKPGKKWRIVAGHRRYVAHQINEEKTIRATINTTLGDELKAKTFNLVENIKREDLNVKQEAHALKDYVKYGWKNREIQEELQVTSGWLTPRLALLRLPDDVQNEAALKMFTMNQIVELSKIEDMDALYAAVRRIKEAKERGEALEVTAKPRKIKPYEKRARTRGEMFDMQDLIRESFGNSLATRVLGWASGEVSDYEIMGDLKILAGNEGVPFAIPEKMLKAINS